jgi:hypothetical protein
MVPVIFDDEQQRVLRYVHAANTGGYRPTSKEVEEWRARPDALPGKRGKLIRAAEPGTPSPVVASMMASFAPLANSLSRSMLANVEGFASAGLLGSLGRPAKYEPDGPPESPIAQMLRLSWLADDRGGLSLTPLSRALLRAEESANEGNEIAEVLVLAQDDPLAYAKLLGHIADAGRVLIVDPYLRAEPLLSLLTATQADRFLIGVNVSERDRATMITLVNSGAAGRAELRRAKAGAVHDRLVIGATRVQSIGMSLNAIGRTGTTVLMSVPDASADHLREIAEQWWAEGEVIAFAQHESESKKEPATSPRPTAKKRSPRKRAAPAAPKDKTSPPASDEETP